MLRAFCFALALIAATPAMAQPAGVEWGSISLYQAELLDTVLPEVDSLSAYMRSLRTEADRVFASAPPRAPVSGLLFVAVKPGGRARVWVLPEDVAIAPDLEAALEQRLSALPPVPVQHGFLFALSFGAAGAAPYDAGAVPPIPRAWEVQIPPEGIMLDDTFINRVWPD